MAVPGVWLVEPERLTDERGHFARVFSADEYASRGLDPAIEQCSTSFNHRAGTLRGLHYQAEPHGEAKLVRCTRGRDLRRRPRPPAASRRATCAGTQQS